MIKVSECPVSQQIFQSPFKPAWWLTNPHAQTLYSTFFRKPIELRRHREEVILDDGDFVDVDWHIPSAWQEDKPIVLVVHGLSGSSESHYVLGLQKALAQMDWASVAFNCRGASGRQNRSTKAYHAGADDELRQTVNYIQKKYPKAALALVGYSLGGSMSLNLLGKLPEKSTIFAAVAVSVPLVLSVCSTRMDKGFSRVYRQHFMQELTAHWQAKKNYLQQEGRHQEAEYVQNRLAQGPFRSFWQFDHELIAPLHGFADVHDYYHRSSARQFLAHIHTPTLIIQSSDDPFMTPSVLPAADELSQYVTLEVCQRGGHVGFITGNMPGRPVYYLEQRIPEYLSTIYQS